MYNVFDTEQEAIDAENDDFLAWKVTQDQSNSDYWSVTDRWDTPIQRTTDNKWVYKVCPEGNQNHTQDAYDSSWFPDPQA
jgi:hypothetical protein